MKDNFVHVCFVIDNSGSMYDSYSDVVNGYKKVIDEQKAETVGTCTVSLYTFNSDVIKHYVGKDINEVSNVINYDTGGLTAMNDGIGTAIDDIGKWLSDMNEDDRPSKNIIIIMTDGGENASTEYGLKRVRDMIKEQTEKYSWEFVYMGTDITTSKDADDLGIVNRAYTTRDDYSTNYSFVSNSAKAFRCMSADDAKTTMDSALLSMNDTYRKKTGLNLS